MSPPLKKKLFKTSNQEPEFSQETISEGIRFIFNNVRSIILLLSILPAGLGLLMWNKVDNTILVSWLIFAVLVSSSRYFLAKHYFKIMPDDNEIMWFGRIFTYTSLASGLLYGSAAVLFFTPESIPIQLFLFIFIIGMANGSTFTSSHLLESYYAFMIPAFSLSIVQLFIQPDITYKYIAFLLLVNMIMAFSIGKKSQRSVLSSIQLRFENARLVDELTDSVKKADDANHRKTRFLASASHDLRQPVHALGLFSEALENEQLSEKGLNTLSFLKKSVSSLSELLNSLLDVSRLDAGVITPNISTVDASQLLTHLANDFRGECDAKALTLRCRIQKNLWVKSDSILLENIFRNLITNAIRYTNTGGILLAGRRKGDEVWLEVWDSGIGISDMEQQEIFDEFYQINNAERDRQQGLGLGLAIVKRQSELLQHELSFQSRVGQGTLFRIKLPAEKELTQETLSESIFSSDQLYGRSILVIDDEEAILAGMRLTLESWGCVVQTASNLSEALQCCEINIPDIMIVDFRLRDHVTGISVVEKLRAELDSNIPALLITGDTAPDRLQQAQDSGLLLLHKPVKPVKLRAALNLI